MRRCAALPVIAGVERLIILVDHDAAGTDGVRRLCGALDSVPGAPSSR